MERIDTNTVFGFWPKRKLDASASALVSRMDAADVDKALTCSIRGWLYDYKQGNDETLRMCADSGGRLLPVATINPNRFFGMIEEVDRIIESGFRVVRFFPHEQEWHITQRHFGRLLKKLAETDLILMVPSTEGFSRIADVFGEVPNKIIIETVRAYPELAVMIVSMQETDNLYAEMHLVGGMDHVATLTEEVGEDRLLFGSGAPLHCITSASLPILNASISDAARSSIFSENILGLLERRDESH